MRIFSFFCKIFWSFQVFPSKNFFPDSLKGFQDFVRLLVSALKTPSDTWFLETDVLIYSLLVHCIIFVLIAVFLNYLHLFWLLPLFLQIQKVSFSRWYFKISPLQYFLYWFIVVRLDGFSPWFLQRYTLKLYF